jgi:hypothetical protein
MLADEAPTGAVDGVVGALLEAKPAELLATGVRGAHWVLQRSITSGRSLSRRLSHRRRDPAGPDDLWHQARSSLGHAAAGKRHRLPGLGTLGQMLHLLPRETKPDFKSCAKGEQISVSLAPEPSDVLWENLEVKASERSLLQLTTYVLTTLLVAVSTVIFVQLTVGTKGNRASSAVTISLAAAASCSITGINHLIHTSCILLTHRERHQTKTAFERSLFTKLSIAYVANTVALPLAVGSVPYGVSQAWYESGGPVEQAQVLLFTSVAFTELFKVVQPGA